MKFKLTPEEDIELRIDPITKERTLRVGNDWLGAYFSARPDVTIVAGGMSAPYEVNVATIYKTFGDKTFVFFYLYQEEWKKRLFGLLKPKIIAKNCHMVAAGLPLTPEAVEKMHYYDIAVLLQSHIVDYADYYELGRGDKLVTDVYPKGLNIKDEK